MADLKLRVRYSRELTAPDLPCHEKNLRKQYLNWTIPLDQAALILVDCWNDYALKSYIGRSKAIIQKNILPTLKISRQVGMKIIHAPGPAWASNYPAYRWMPEALPENEYGAWPPKTFQYREGTYSEFYYPLSVHEPAYLRWLRNNPQKSLRIAKALSPCQGDIVIANRTELHQFCSDKKILHLFYAGFATNICLQFRDYGMRAMKKKGYNVMLLRDCTTGIEVAKTVNKLSLTKAAITNIEMKVAPSLTARELQKACYKVLRK